MMRTAHIIIYSFLLILCLSSCKDFFETSLDGESVEVLAPADSTASNKYNQLFWWNEKDGALYYRLQIAKPDFEKTEELILDTLVKTSKFAFVLEPGSYQWRLRAENGSTKSLYTTHTLTINESSLTLQQVQLKLPANGASTSSDKVTFSWESLFGGSKYRLQIDTNNFAAEDKLVYNNTTANQESLFTFEKERTYQWRVRAENDTTQSKWSTIQEISYDATPPAKVTLKSPATNQSVSKPVSLQWNVISGAKKYQVVVYKNDSTTVINSTFPATVTGTSFEFNEGAIDDRMYWKVRAIDAAENSGPFSDLWNFTIK